MRVLMLLPLALAACQQAAEPTGNTAANMSGPGGMSATQTRLTGLPVAQQKGVFLRAIRDGDAPCQGVTEQHRQPDQDGNPVFVVRCDDGPVYAIVVNRDGVAQVTRVSADRR